MWRLGRLRSARPKADAFLDSAVSRLRWAILATALLITLAWPIASRTGHPIWLYLLGFGVYNLLVELLRHRVSSVSLRTWVPILDLLAAGALYYFDAEPGGPLYILFFVAVVSAAVSLPLLGAVAYTLAAIAAIAVVAPTLPLWTSSEPYIRQFATRLVVLFAVGLGTAYLTRLLSRERETSRAARGQAERLEELDRLRGAFISSVSHELRTPLTSARLGLSMLESRAHARLDPDERVALGAVRRNLERLTFHIDDLLAFNQAEAGVLRIRHEPLDLRAVVADALGAVHPLLEDKGQAVELDLPDSLPAAGDARRLAQVVVNLLDNAHYHTPAGTRVAVTGQATARETHLAVSDDGPGIPAGELERIFDRFHRVGAAGGGSGLGLATAKAIIELHGGRVWAESAPGRGATFHLALPRPPDGRKGDA